MTKDSITFMDDDATCYIAYDYDNESEALQALAKYDDECGMVGEECFSGELSEVSMVEIVKNDEPFYSWKQEDLEANPDKIKKGFICYV